MGAQIIVINGKKYDAKTGRLLEQTATHSQTRPKQDAVKALDGFSRRPKPAASVVAHAVHKKTEKSQTLMRGAVKKPVSNKVHAKAHNVAHKAAAAHASDDKPFSHERLHRATSVQKSSFISKFGTQKTVPTASAPAHNRSVAHLPVKKAPAISAHQDAPLPISRTYENPFAKAVENATSHQQFAPKKQTRRHKIARALRISPRMVSVGTTVLAVALLGGFFVFQNIPNMAMKVAATRSGVNAHMPGYKPGGFAVHGPITYTAGKITVNFKSTTDDRSFKVVQSNSGWNSETLLDNFVAVNRRSYQTFQDKGKTIYIYDGNNATWIDRGVWYQIEGASSLNSDQLIRIANSL